MGRAGRYDELPDGLRNGINMKMTGHYGDDGEEDDEHDEEIG